MKGLIRGYSGLFFVFMERFTFSTPRKRIVGM